MNEMQIGGVQVANPTSPHGSSQSSFNLTNTYDANGSAFIDNNVLLFEITKSQGDHDRCTVAVTDPSNNGIFSASGYVEWQVDDTSTQYIEFSNFPLQADQTTPTTECDYTMSILNIDANDSGTNVDVTIYRG